MCVWGGGGGGGGEGRGGGLEQHRACLVEWSCKNKNMIKIYRDQATYSVPLAAH